MKYKMWFDEKHSLARIILLHSLTKEEAEHMLSEMKELLIENNVRKGIMDLTQADNTKISKESREVYRKNIETFPLDKIAVIVNSPIVRMFAKVALTALGKMGVARFFKTEDQALKWLEETNI